LVASYFDELLPILSIEQDLGAGIDGRRKIQMSQLKIAPGDWVIVCDGKKALVFENTGSRAFPSLVVKEVREQEDPRTSEQGTGAPGRAFQSVGTARSAMEQTDWHEEAEHTFLRTLVHDVEKALTSGKVKGLVVVAPPRALGVIRQAWPQTHRSAIRAEVSHDYVKLPVDEIERRLFG
jgi:protein required for attachment to host cells